MGVFSTWLKTALVDWAFGGANPTRPTGWEVSLHTGDPGAAGTANEVGGGVGYARRPATFTAAAAGAATNTATITFGPASGAGFGTVTFAAVWDTGTGQYLGKSALTAQLVPAGIPYSIPAGDLDVAVVD